MLQAAARQLEVSKLRAAEQAAAVKKNEQSDTTAAEAGVDQATAADEQEEFAHTVCLSRCISVMD